MTDPSEVKISDAHLNMFLEANQLLPCGEHTRKVFRWTLQELIARRVPPAEIEPSPYAWDYDDINMAAAHNSLRDQILNGQ